MEEQSQALYPGIPVKQQFCFVSYKRPIDRCVRSGYGITLAIQKNPTMPGNTTLLLIGISIIFGLSSCQDLHLNRDGCNDASHTIILHKGGAPPTGPG